MEIIYCLKKHFARYGIPKMVYLMSDSASQFLSCEFQNFCKKWAILHTTFASGNQRENGKAESAVKSAKHLLHTTTRNHEDQYLALLELRNTPRQDVNLSPTEILSGRQIRSILLYVIKNPSAKIYHSDKKRLVMILFKDITIKQPRICLLFPRGTLFITKILKRTST